MNRIPSDRTGYSGYACCAGDDPPCWSPFSLPAMDCYVNKYYALPARMKGAITNTDQSGLWAFHNELAQITDDIIDPSPSPYSPLREKITTCPADYDPVTGVHIDLLGEFMLPVPSSGSPYSGRQDLSVFIDQYTCFPLPSDTYGLGFIDPVPNVVNYAGGDGGACQTSCGPPTPPVMCNVCVTVFETTCSCPYGTCEPVTVRSTECGKNTLNADKWIYEGDCTWSYKMVDFSTCCTDDSECVVPQAPSPPVQRCCNQKWSASWDEFLSAWVKTPMTPDCGLIRADTAWDVFTDVCYTEMTKVSSTCCESQVDCGDTAEPDDPTQECKHCYVKWTSDYKCDNTGWTDPVTSGDVTCGDPGETTWQVSEGSNSCSAYIWKKTPTVCADRGSCSIIGATPPDKPVYDCPCYKCYSHYTSDYNCDGFGWRAPVFSDTVHCGSPSPTVWTITSTSTNHCAAEIWVQGGGDECSLSSDCSKSPDPAAPTLPCTCSKCYTKWTATYTCGTGHWVQGTATNECLSVTPAAGWIKDSGTSSGCTAHIYLLNNIDTECQAQGDCSHTMAWPGLPTLACSCNKCQYNWTVSYNCATGAFSSATYAGTCVASCTSHAYNSYGTESPYSNTCTFTGAITCSTKECGADANCNGVSPAPTPPSLPSSSGCTCGACCNGTSCSKTTFSYCEGQGRLWDGGAASCTPNPCNPDGHCAWDFHYVCMGSPATWTLIGTPTPYCSTGSTTPWTGTFPAAFSTYVGTHDCWTALQDCGDQPTPSHMPDTPCPRPENTCYTTWYTSYDCNTGTFGGHSQYGTYCYPWGGDGYVPVYPDWLWNDWGYGYLEVMTNVLVTPAYDCTSTGDCTGHGPAAYPGNPSNPDSHCPTGMCCHDDGSCENGVLSKNCQPGSPPTKWWTEGGTCSGTTCPVPTQHCLFEGYLGEYFVTHVWCMNKNAYHTGECSYDNVNNLRDWLEDPPGSGIYPYRGDGRSFGVELQTKYDNSLTCQQMIDLGGWDPYGGTQSYIYTGRGP